MPADTASSLYEQLAEKYHARGKYPERDRFLILAADAAWNAGHPDAAEVLRKRILEYNPNHLLRPYGSLAEALKSADILAYVQQLRRGYPRERAVELMKELDQDPRGKPGEGYSVPMEPGAVKGGGVFKLADDKPAAKPAAKNQLPPQLSQSQSLYDDKPKKLAPPPPAWTAPAPVKSAVPTASVTKEPTAGAAVGTLLFSLLLAASLAALGYVFVWPFFRS